MNYKTITLLLSSMISSNLQATDTDSFAACKLNVLASNCNIGRNEKAPAFMKKGGPASCFVGLDIAPKKDKRVAAAFQQIITEEKYLRSGLEEEIKKIKLCLVDLESLRKCDIGYATAARLIDEIQLCK